MTLGYDVDTPWKKLPKKDRDWLLFTDEQPVVPVYAGYTPKETARALKRKEEPSYMGTFTGARRYVIETFAKSPSALMKKRAARYMVSGECPLCHGKRLRRESLAVTFAGRDFAEMSRVPLGALAELMAPFAAVQTNSEHPETALVVQRIAGDLLARVAVLNGLGLGYLTMERSTPTLSPGELQRLRLATQVRSNLFGVVYVLDEPSAGLHPADTEALLDALDRLKRAGNSLFVVEHELDIIQHADWIVDVGPAAGERGGEILYSGPRDGLRNVAASETRKHLFGSAFVAKRVPRAATGMLELTGVTRNNVHDLDVAFPLGVLTTVTGISGSGKSSLVSQALIDLVTAALGAPAPVDTDERDELEREPERPTEGRIAGGIDRIKRLVRVDQKTDRPHAALESRNVHRPVRCRAHAVRRNEGCAGQEVRRRPLLIQRGKGPVCDVRGRRVRDGRALVSAERICAVARPVTVRAITPIRSPSGIARSRLRTSSR